MSISLSKSFFGIQIPVWKQGDTQTKKLVKGTYVFSFENVDMNKYLFTYLDDQLPFVTSLQYDNEPHTLKIQRLRYDENHKRLHVELYVTSPPIALIIGGIGLLGIGSYALYRVQRVFTLPIWYIAGGLAAWYIVKKA